MLSSTTEFFAHYEGMVVRWITKYYSSLHDDKSDLASYNPCDHVLGLDKKQSK